MIAPEFLASLRRQLRAEMVLVLVQLEQVCPGWWPDLYGLAEQLGTDRATLNRSVRKLEDLGLLRRVSLANGGTWFWWVKRHAADAPDPAAEPAWVLRDVHRRQEVRITVATRWEWATARKIPRETMRNFLLGGCTLLRDRWQLVSTPMDCYEM